MMDAAGQSHRAEHFSLLKPNRYAATAVMNILDGLIPIESVLDLGCGLGTWLEVCVSTKQGRQIFGVEIEEFSADELRVEPGRIVCADLGQPIDLHRRFDLVLCLETAEHLDSAAAGALVSTCTRHSDVILFSAALPGQGGQHHVNEQLPEYWETLFGAHEFEAIDLIRPLIWNDRHIPVWYRQNMLVFVRKDSAAREKLLEAVRPPPLGRAHPEMLDMLARRATEFQSALDAVTEKVGYGEAELQRARADLEALLHRETEKSRVFGQRLEAARTRATDLSRKIAEFQSALDAERRRSSTVLSEKKRSESENQSLRSQLQTFRDQTARLLEEIQAANVTLTLMRTSTSWRMSAPVRWLGNALPNSRRTATRRAMAESLSPNVLIGPDAPPSKPAEDSRSDQIGNQRRTTKVVFVSGEPNTPGHHYRVAYMAHCLPARSFDAIICGPDAMEGEDPLLLDAQILWFWRVPWSESFELTVQSARRSGASIIYDIDDLMFRPELARVDIIDGIRTQQFEEAEVHAFYARVQKALCLADLCLTTTQTLAQEICQVFSGPVYVVPNGFDRGALQWAEAAREAADAERSDGLIRIGYAAGTLTHQRDFEAAVPALVTLLTERPQTRLVLFGGTIDISEFPDLKALDSQIEWRERVPLVDLLYEYARFDINIVPLEVGNRFCEAKSELKFFEAALVCVPTVASPTGTFLGSIEDGVTGFLARTSDDWYCLLHKLSKCSDLRKRVGEHARNVVIWRHGPERRALTIRRLSESINSDKSIQAVALIRELQEETEVRSAVSTPDYEVVFEQGRRGKSRVAVIIPVFNYAHLVTEALDSTLAQTEREFDLIVVDDCSTDGSLEVVTKWLNANGPSFNHVALLKNVTNSKLGATRNAGIHFARTELYLPLDADNALQPSCIARLLQEIDETDAAFAYPKIESFGDTKGEVWHISDGKWDPNRLRFGNYIDAMALVRTACWSAVGGYVPYLYGWEDYDFWCSFVEHGFFGAQVPEVLARYRYHEQQMIRTLTAKNEERVHTAITARHRWLRLGGAVKPVAGAPATAEEASGIVR